jgi:UDP-N-acetylmuramoyl-L-alanyl-D-glutamate--2,6-diaminopimelate ligase
MKRGSMGEAAAGNADLVVVTDDNPRSESPEVIREEVLAGARAAVERDGLATEVLDGGDRRSAIRLALADAGRGDVVAVLGRGHEPEQEIAGRRVPFNDAVVVAEEWAALREVHR